MSATESTASAPDAAEPPSSMKQIAAKVFRFFSSIGVALVMLVFLLLITWIGTEEQPEKGLFLVQEEYFKSWWLTHTFEWPIVGSVTLPLPGVMLILCVFTINLICGGLIMLRKSMRTVGVMISHFSILFLLAGGLLQHQYAKDGYMQLYEGEESDEFVSYHDWVIRIHEVENGEANFEKEAMVIPPNVLHSLGENGEGTRLVNLQDLPFDLRLRDHSINSTVMPEAFHRPGELPVVDEVFLRPVERDPEGEANVAGLYVDVLDEKGEAVDTGLLWGLENHPWTLNVGDQTWLLKLERERWKIPFTVHLDNFTHEFHPNTGTPRVYKSDVTKIEEGEEEKLVIEMNEPLRHRGFILFQSGWGPQENGRPVPGTPYSVFAVWRNPSSKILFIPVEHWPLVTVSIAALGMTIHFLLKLSRHLAPGRRRRNDSVAPNSSNYRVT